MKCLSDYEYRVGSKYWLDYEDTYYLISMIQSDGKVWGVKDSSTILVNFPENIEVVNFEY